MDKIGLLLAVALASVCLVVYRIASSDWIGLLLAFEMRNPNTMLHTRLIRLATGVIINELYREFMIIKQFFMSLEIGLKRAVLATGVAVALLSVGLYKWTYYREHTCENVVEIFRWSYAAPECETPTKKVDSMEFTKMTKS